MIAFGNKTVDDIFYGDVPISCVYKGNNLIWTPTEEPSEEGQFIPDEHHPVDPMFDDYYGWTIYLKINAENGDKVKFPQGGTYPLILPSGTIYPMVIYDFYNQGWEQHTDLFDNTFRLSKEQVVEYGQQINQYDIEILNPSDSLMPVCEKIGGIGSTSWSVSYRNGVWSNGNELLSELYIGDFTDLTEIDTHAFKDNTNLKNIRLNSWLWRIAFSAFDGCSSLKIADLRNCSALNSIENKAFANCTSLEKIILPRVGSVYKNFLQGCTSLQRIVLLAENVPDVIDDNTSDTHFTGIPRDVVVCVPNASLQAYKLHPVWGTYDVRPYIEDDFVWEYQH